MRTIIYDLQVTTDIAHGWTSVIREMCVPSLGLFVNPECAFLLGKKDAKFRLSSRKNVLGFKPTAKQSAIFRKLAKAIKERDEIVEKIQENWFNLEKDKS